MNANTLPVEDFEYETEGLARHVAQWSWDLKGLNTVVIDLRGRVSYTDFVVVTTATSERHVKALSRLIDEKVGDYAHKDAYGKEGVDHGQWALLDYGDVIVHIFNGPVREDYDLERMWPDAPRMEFDEKPNDLYGHFELEEFEEA